MAIGPTGSFTMGEPIEPGDQSSVAASFGRIIGQRALRLNFGTEVSWVALPPAQALAMAQQLRSAVREQFGNLSYNPKTLPIRVVGNTKKWIVGNYFPEPLSMLVANPEFFLGWADHLEREARLLLASRIQ